MGNAREIAEVVAILASDAAGYITGENITVVGGSPPAALTSTRRTPVNGPDPFGHQGGSRGTGRGPARAPVRETAGLRCCIVAPAPTTCLADVDTAEPALKLKFQLAILPSCTDH
ncbi:hypothetical protein [Actinoplanes sp. M2I2]|uniref:hypothetical protein n=1 Tax=Actinoplanes sp. M2I2 TaxID=1734444 RepID=UPI0035AF1717